jgi:preprotein translocase subunit SecD
MVTKCRNFKILCRKKGFRMKKIKRLFTEWKILLLIFVLIMSLILLFPDLSNEGVAIRNIAKNSSAEISGLKSPLPELKPMFREVIIEVNGNVIKNTEDYYNSINSLEINDTITIKTKSKYDSNTNKKSFFSKINKYYLEVKPKYNITILNETVEKITNKTIIENQTINGTITQVNKTVEVIEYVPKKLIKIIGPEDIGIDVYNAPKTNLKKGLDLQGGTRVLLEPDREIDNDEIDLIINNLQQRLNVFGLSDIVIRPVQRGLFDKTIIIVEIAGAHEDEVRSLISGQGKFEAKIGDTVVFSGGKDLTNVCRTPECSSAIDPQRPPHKIQEDTWISGFYFSITLTEEAANKIADATKNLEIIFENQNEYLSEKLSLYLDDELVDELNIGADLKGRPATNIQISGTGSGFSRQEAITDSSQNMKKLQTLLITGSLPVKLEIIKADSISPILGDKFTKNAIIVGLCAILSVSIVIFIRYRQLKLTIPLLITIFAEVIMILGIAAGIGWNLDLAAIAGIIIAIGTGIDHQVIIIDEALKSKKRNLAWKESLKRAFFIIFAAFFTTITAMFVLFISGAGLLRGFALTTIIGVVVGVLISRPAFAKIIEILYEDES